MEHNIEQPKLTGKLQASNDLMGDIDAIRVQFQKDGYLLFRDVIDTAEITAMAKRWVTELQRQGFLDEKEEWTDSKPIEDIDENAIHETLAYEKLWQHSSMQKIFDLVFDEPAWVFKHVGLRNATPKFGRYLLPPHQDGTYVGPTQDFLNLWIPMCDISPETNGGVAIAKGSQVTGAREHIVTEVEPFKFGGGKIKMAGIPMENVSEPWLSTDFKVGDLLLFMPFTVHAGLPNLTQNKMRLSLDARFQPLSVPRGHFALHTAAEHKRMATEQGAWDKDAQVESK